MQFDNGLPIYLQIVKEMTLRALSGAIKPGEKIPPVRELAAEFGVNPNTMQRAMAEMERESHLRPDGHLHEGMTVYVLGQGYRLHLAEGPLGMDDSQKEQGELVLYLTAGQEVAAKEVYLAWLKAQSGSVFLASLERMLAKTAAEGFCRPTLRVRNMKTRWGSCKPSEGKITLNLQLMKADLDCIDQVMLHELIHLKEPRHNDAFYERMDRYMPDWRQRKERLETEYQDGL